MGGNNPVELIKMSIYHTLKLYHITYSAFNKTNRKQQEHHRTPSQITDTPLTNGDLCHKDAVSP